jgi:hypothetical protein
MRRRPSRFCDRKNDYHIRGILKEMDGRDQWFVRD